MCLPDYNLPRAKRPLFFESKLKSVYKKLRTHFLGNYSADAYLVKQSLEHQSEKEKSKPTINEFGISLCYTYEIVQREVIFKFSQLRT